MFQVLKVFLDPFGEECKKTYENLTAEKKKPAAPPPPEEKIVDKIEKPKHEPPPREKQDKFNNSEPPPRSKDRNMYHRPPYVNRDYPTPNSDVGYGTQSEYSASYSSGSTPMGYEFPANNNYPPSYPPFNTYHPQMPPPPQVWQMQHWPNQVSDWPNAAPPPESAHKHGGWVSPRDRASSPGKKKLKKKRCDWKERDKHKEDNKNLDLDTRIAMLLKGKGSNKVAPSFLQFGSVSDSDDELRLNQSASSINHASQKHPVSTSVDSDDDCSSVSLSDLPINPPPPESGRRFSAKDDDPSLPLSCPPSPFLSKELYLQCHRLAIEQATLAKQREALETSVLLMKTQLHDDKLGSDISSSEDELLTGGDRIEDHYSPIGKSPKEEKNDKDDDRMSLSSLSSGEKIEVIEKTLDDSPVKHFQQYPGYNNYPNIITSPYYPASSQPPATHTYDWRNVYPYPTPNLYAFPLQYPLTPSVTPVATPTITPSITPSITPTMTPSMTPIPTPNVTPKMTPKTPQTPQTPQYPSPFVVTPPKKPAEAEINKNDPHYPLINLIVEKVTEELKLILRKDFNKKMIENTAYKRFESWWEEQESQKEVVVISKENNVIPTKDNINVLLENHKDITNNISLDSVGLGSSFGLGLRASLPKMPSFRRKKVPSPGVMDDDSRKSRTSDQEEMVDDSDSESTPIARMPLRRVRKASSSSSSSKSSAFSSSSEGSSSDNESSSDEDEMTNVRRIGRSKTPEGRSTPVPSEGGFSLPDESSRDGQLDDSFRDSAFSASSALSAGSADESEDMKNRKVTIKITVEEIEEKSISSEKSSKSSVLPSVENIVSSEEEEERLYMERRKRNTEYMEQIERERQQKEQEELELRKKEEEKVKKERPKEDLNNKYKEDRANNKHVHVKDRPKVVVEKAVVDRKENSRSSKEGDVSQIAYTAVSALMELSKTKESSDEENLIQRKQKRRRGRPPLNGIVKHLRISESSDGSSSPISHVAFEHSYCLPPKIETTKTLIQLETENMNHGEALEHDHVYTTITITKKIDKSYEKMSKPRKPRGGSHTFGRQFRNIQNTMEPPPPARPSLPHYKHKERDMMQECHIMYEFLTKGVDAEDMRFLRVAYDSMLRDDAIGYWLNDTHWVDHCITDLCSSPPKRRKTDERVHATGKHI